MDKSLNVLYKSLNVLYKSFNVFNFSRNHTPLVGEDSKHCIRGVTLKPRGFTHYWGDVKVGGLT